MDSVEELVNKLRDVIFKEDGDINYTPIEVVAALETLKLSIAYTSVSE